MIRPSRTMSVRSGRPSHGTPAASRGCAAGSSLISRRGYSLRGEPLAGAAGAEPAVAVGAERDLDAAGAARGDLVVVEQVDQALQRLAAQVQARLGRRGAEVVDGD